MKILVVAAHPDDEVLGCGGTIAKLSKFHDIYSLILGEGITSRDIADAERKKGLIELRKHSQKANAILGVKNVYYEKFSDNRFDSHPLLDIIKTIEQTIQNIKPDTIFTHHFGDLNIDHCITHQAVLVAARPAGQHRIKKLFSFEILSSTEWNTQNPSTLFSPNTYVDIEETIDVKISAIQAYRNELREYPHPRSIEAIRILAQKRGMDAGLRYAEAFSLIRGIE
jgi:LmbE family N-acetylglucosaminyl deacetylase